LVHQPASTIVHFLASLLNPRWHIPDLADWNKLPAGQGTTEGWTHLRSVADYSNVVVVADSLFLRAFDDKVLKQAVDSVRHTIGLRSTRIACAKRVSHRPRLIYQKKET
jgi:hypothetical protein